MSRYDAFWPGLRWQPPVAPSRPRRSPFGEVIRERAEPVPHRVALPVDEPETSAPVRQHDPRFVKPGSRVLREEPPLEAPTAAEAPHDAPQEDAPIDDTETLRAAARELEATRGRLEREARRTQDEVKAKLVGELLPVMDNLDRTLRATHDGSDDALVEGVRMVRAQLEQVLARYGVERIEALGARFDPGLHEAIATRTVPEAQVGQVVDQAEAGYRFAGKVLRAAKVVVGARDE